MSVKYRSGILNEDFSYKESVKEGGGGVKTAEYLIETIGVWVVVCSWFGSGSGSGGDGDGHNVLRSVNYTLSIYLFQYKSPFIHLSPALL